MMTVFFFGLGGALILTGFAVETLRVGGGGRKHLVYLGVCRRVEERG